MPYRQKGSPYWYISYTASGGKRVRESSGETSFKAAKALEAKRRVESHQSRKWGEKPDKSIEEVLATYLLDNESNGTNERDLFCAARIKECFEGRMIHSLNGEDMAAYTRQRRKDGVADATIAKELQTLSKAIRYCNNVLEWNLPNPVPGRTPKGNARKLRWLTKDEARKLIDSCMPGSNCLDFVELGLATGMRHKEILALEWSRVDFTHRLIHFGSQDHKARRPATIPLSDWACEVLRRRTKTGKYVFPARGKRGHMESMKKPFARAADKAKLKDITPHTLRHTFGAWAVQAGVPIRTVCDLMRHSDIKTTMIYAHLAPENAAEAIKLITPPVRPDLDVKQSEAV